MNNVQDENGLWNPKYKLFKLFFLWTAKFFIKENDKIKKEIIGKKKMSDYDR